MSQQDDLRAMLMGGIDAEAPPAGRPMNGAGPAPDVRRGGNGGGGPPNNRGPGQGGGGGGGSAANPVSPGFFRIQKRVRRSPALGFFGLMIGLLLWIINSEYTAHGLVTSVNTISNWLRYPLNFGMLPVYYSLPLGIAAGLLITFGQIVEFPFDFGHFMKSKEVIFYGWPPLIVWMFVSGFDLWTTGYGFVQLRPDAWDVHRQAADSLFLTGVYSLILAFGPEFLIASCWKMLGWPVPAFLKR